MKIRTRLSLTTSFIASVVLLSFAFTIYVFSANHREQSFQKRLKQRVIVTEKIFLEKESFSEEELAKITDQFLHTLPKETEELVALDIESHPAFKYNYPQDVISQFWKKEVVDFKDSRRQGECRRFHVKGKDYLIIVTAEDQVGFRNLRFLKNIIFLLIIIGVPVIFISSFYLTKRALLPLSRKIAEANNIEASTLNQRLKVLNPEDEIGMMAIAFNKLLDRLEEAFEMQKSFIRNASHEIKNPLTTIMGEADLAMSMDRSKEEYMRSLKIILSESDVLNGTVNNLLHLSKISANEKEILIERLDFTSLIKESIKSFAFQNNEAKITFEGFESDSYLVDGNPNLLQSVIGNLLDNACKFSGNDEVKVNLKKNDREIELKIIDKGLGIKPNELSKIDTPFYRGTNVIHIKGSGIGLALCARIVKLHDGIMVINSILNKGTEVLIRLKGY